MGQAERGRPQTVQGRTDGHAAPCLRCALALFEKTSWAGGQQRSRGEERSRGVREQRRQWAVSAEGANSKGAEKYEGNKGKSVGPLSFPFYGSTYTSLCSLAPKPRRTGINGPCFSDSIFFSNS